MDYFSSSGAYRENGTTVHGSPVLGVKALDEIKGFFANQTNGLTPTTTAILFEEDRQKYNQLLATLEGHGYAKRLKQTDNLLTLRDGEIAVIRGDSSQYIERVLEFIELIDPTYSFHFIDPYGAKGVERSNIEKIVSKKGTDCIINMMLNYFSRWISVAKPVVESHPTVS